MSASADQWARKLRSVAVIPAEDLDEWCQLPPDATASSELTFRVAERVCAATALAATSPSTALNPAKVLCQALSVLCSVLGKGGSEAAARIAAELLPQLDPAYEVLARHAYAELLKPWGRALEQEALRLPLLLLARCIAPERITIAELLVFARGDLATGVAIATAVVAGPSLDGSPLPQRVQTRMWQLLYQLSTPHGAAEVLGTALSESNCTPIEELRAQQCAHLHRLSMCFLKFGTLEVACSCAQEPHRRLAVVTTLLSTLYNLVAAPDLALPGQLIGRHILVHWHSFGLRFLAPHLRRLLDDAGNNKVAEAELRYDLRFLGWILQHCPELRRTAKPLCTELALRALRFQHPVPVMAAAIAVAAKAEGLIEDEPLYVAVQSTEGLMEAVLRELDAFETVSCWPTLEAAPSPERSASCIRDSEVIIAAHPRVDPYGLDDFEELATIEPEDASGSTAESEERLATCSQPMLPTLAVALAPPPVPTKAHTTGTCQAVALPTPTALLCTAPPQFRCAIDGRLCSDPVRSPAGILFERSQILAWLRWRKVCPVQGCPLTEMELSEEPSMRAAISAWLVQNGAVALVTD